MTSPLPCFLNTVLSGRAMRTFNRPWPCSPMAGLVLTFPRNGAPGCGYPELGLDGGWRSAFISLPRLVPCPCPDYNVGFKSRTCAIAPACPPEDHPYLPLAASRAFCEGTATAALAPGPGTRGQTTLPPWASRSWNRSEWATGALGRWTSLGNRGCVGSVGQNGRRAAGGWGASVRCLEARIYGPG